jgi:hypothetical protein
MVKHPVQDTTRVYYQGEADDLAANREMLTHTGPVPAEAGEGFAAGLALTSGRSTMYLACPWELSYPAASCSSDGNRLGGLTLHSAEAE